MTLSGWAYMAWSNRFLQVESGVFIRRVIIPGLIPYGFGLALACATGLGAWLFDHPFLTTHTAHVDWPLVGELHLPSAFVFDLGVFATVVGTTMLMLVALAHQSLRAHRQPDDDAPAADETRRTI